MKLEFVSGVSVILQVAAAIFALRLIRVSGKRAAWALLSAAIFLMAIRRGFTLFRLISGEMPDSLDFWYEIIGLLTSMFMLAGLVSIGPIFAAIRSTEENLRRSEKRFHDIASSLGEGIYLMNEHGQVTFMNSEAERLLGWTESELMNRNVHDVVHNRKSDGTPLALEDCGMRGVIRTGETYYSRDEMFIRKDGTTFPISVISAPMREDGKIIGAISAFSDISETKRMEQEQKRLFLELENAVATIKTLRGILPVCASCKKIRDESGSWKEIEVYIGERTDAQFRHGVCPECTKKLYPWYSGKKQN
jgi:PAS domain S-box-containing protein